MGRRWAKESAQIPMRHATPRGFPLLFYCQAFATLSAYRWKCSSTRQDSAPGSADWKTLVRSSLHSVISDDGPPWTVRLQPGERLNRDFILRFPVAGDAIQTSLQVTPASDGKPGTFALIMVPPKMVETNPPPPRDVVFLLDRSGSMEGWKMVAARRSVGRMIDTLLGQDRFTVMAFDYEIEQPSAASEGLINATNRDRSQTMEWLGKIEARGGTDLRPALAQALRLLSATTAPRDPVLVLITDGQVSGEDLMLQTVTNVAGDNIPRIYTLGIDQAVNVGFLQRLADVGRGRCDFVESEDQLDAAMDRIHRSIATPVLTDIRVESLDAELLASSLAPSRIPNLFPDCPVVIYGQHRGNADSLRLRICGTTAHGEPWQQDVSGRDGPIGVLESLWGRSRVRELEDCYAANRSNDQSSLAKQIVDVSLATHVLSRFTAYVAVDRSQVVNAGGRQHEIIQPVDMPAGWDMSLNAQCRPDFGDQQICCCISPPTGASTPRVLRQFARRTIAEAVVVLRESMERLVKSDPTDSIKCGELLVHLMAAAAEIGRLLKQSDLVAATAWEDLVEQGQRLLADCLAGDKAAISGSRLADYLNACREQLARLEAQPDAASAREKFWA